MPYCLRQFATACVHISQRLWPSFRVRHGQVYRISRLDVARHHQSRQRWQIRPCIHKIYKFRVSGSSVTLKHIHPKSEKEGKHSRTGISLVLLLDWWLPARNPNPTRLDRRRPGARPGVKGVRGVIGVRAVERSSGEIGTPDWRRMVLGVVGVAGSVVLSSPKSKLRAMRKGLRSLFLGLMRARMAT